MALENNQKLPSFKHSSAKSTLRAGVLAALAVSFLPNSASAQTDRSTRCRPIEGVHTTREWFDNSRALYQCANQAPNPSERRALALGALNALYHALTDSSNIGELSPEARLAMEFNVRTIGMRAFGVEPLQLPPMQVGSSPTPAAVEAVNRVIRANNGIKTANLAALGSIVNGIRPTGAIVTLTERPQVLSQIINQRRFAAFLLDKTDINLTALTGVFIDTMRPVMARLGMCGPSPSALISRETTQVLNTLFCGQRRPMTYDEFLIIVRDPSLRNALPNGQSWPQQLVEGSSPLTGTRIAQIGLGADEISMNALINIMNQQYYLLYFYAHVVTTLDGLSVAFGGDSLGISPRLTNRVSSQDVERVIHPDPEISLVQTPTGPVAQTNPVGGSRLMVQSPQYLDYLQRRAARSSRVRLLRAIGIGAAAAGVITGAVGIGLNLDARNEAQGVISTPEWRARVAETNMFVANARAGMYSAAEIEAGNARTQRYANEYRAAVESFNGRISATQIAAWTGVGVAIFGGALIALADILAGPAPVEPSERMIPATPGQRSPHPAPAGRRADTDEAPGPSVTPGFAVNTDGIQLRLTGTF